MTEPDPLEALVGFLYSIKSQTMIPIIIGESESCVISAANDAFGSSANHYGLRAYLGHERVWRRHNPHQFIWGMNYTGWMPEVPRHLTTSSEKIIFARATFAFLKQALKHTRPEAPVRGPQEYLSDDEQWMYANEMRGRMTHFTGDEKIFHLSDGVRYTVLEGTYHGKLIDV